ncbi:MAG: DUF1559 domain-containing protein [Planctomycetes bacterium]|nr:DUF1559 domain-containing protein [Planctomycetota bacterium]
MKTRRDTAGFTLIELLVVIAIIGILVALLMPAVQAAREAAHRMQCKNNLKQLGLAAQCYHDALTSFPPGFMAIDHQGRVAGGWAWGVYLMPYIEQNPLQDRLSVTMYTLSQVVDNPALLPLLQTRLAVFTCPSSPMGPLREFLGPGSQMVSTANYTCCRGFYMFSGATNLTKRNNGVFYAQSATRLRDVIDGTSNTFAIGERTVLPADAQDPKKWPSWCGPGGLGIGATVSSCVAVKMNHPTDMHAFSSHHPNGANFLYVDGSVHFLLDSIHSNTAGLATGNTGHPVEFLAAVGQVGVYQLLGVINDNQPIPEGD